MAIKSFVCDRHTRPFRLYCRFMETLNRFFTWIKSLFSWKAPQEPIDVAVVTPPAKIAEILIEEKKDATIIIPEIKNIGHLWKDIIVHHSLTEDKQTVEWDGIKRYHMQDKGWHDIGYHFGIEKIGKNYAYRVGRPLSDDGAHTIDFNKTGVGICIVGNFDLAEPNWDQWMMTIHLIKRIMQVFDIPKDNVLGHRETFRLRGVPVEKTCPGSKFSMDKFRADLEAV